MRKTLRLLDWIVNDIDEAKKKLEAVIDDDLGNNEELQEEAEQAEQEIIEARRKILHASDTLRQIYNECYED
jgi:F0F1-type ATP synthase membrane subunit b/b'